MANQQDNLVVHRVKYCQATTKNGKRCCNHVNADVDYCSRHADLFKFPKPSECPVCMDDLKDEHQPLSCGHWVHRHCVLQWKDQCPVCRQKISLTKKERTALEECLEKAKLEEQSDNTLDEQAIMALIRRDLQEYGFAGPIRPTDIMMVDINDDDMDDMNEDLLTRLVIDHVTRNLNRLINLV